MHSDFFIKKLWIGEYSLSISFWFFFVGYSIIYTIINVSTLSLWDTIEKD